MQQTSNSHNRNRQLSQSGDSTTVRFSFAFLRVDERYRDISPTIQGTFRMQRRLQYLARRKTHSYPPMPTHFDDYEKHAQWLEKIANTLETNSPEFVALERAGWALAFVTMRHHHEFQTFLEEKDRGELPYV